MPVDVVALVAIIYEAGNYVIEQCRLAKQCPTEAARIAMRTQNVLGMLQNAAQEFPGDVALETSLLELRRLLEVIRDLVNRCRRSPRITANTRNLFSNKATRDALVNAEAELERVTRDLRLPLLTDIYRELEEIRKYVSRQLAANLEHGTESIITVARACIDKGMYARSAGGASVVEIINDERTKLRSLHEVSTGTWVADGGIQEGRKTSDEPRWHQEALRNLIAHVKRVRFDLLEEYDVIGQGAFGVVLAGTYMGGDVAIKKSRTPILASHDLEDFRREAELHFAMHHPNVVGVIAFSLGDERHPPCLIMERMEESLYDLLGVPMSKLSFPNALKIIIDICEGLLFLHTYKIVHRDLKSLNVLLDGAGNAKLSDFGLANVSSTARKSSGGSYYRRVGPEFWMAPEVHAHRRSSAASDVFSLHVIMWEVLTHQRAGVGSPIGELLWRAPSAKLLLEGVDGPAPLLQRLQQLLDECGAVNGQDRPTVHEITPRIAAMYKVVAKEQSGDIGKAITREADKSHGVEVSYGQRDTTMGMHTAAGNHVRVDSRGEAASTISSPLAALARQNSTGYPPNDGHRYVGSDQAGTAASSHWVPAPATVAPPVPDTAAPIATKEGRGGDSGTGRPEGALETSTHRGKRSRTTTGHEQEVNEEVGSTAAPAPAAATVAEPWPFDTARADAFRVVVRSTSDETIIGSAEADSVSSARGAREDTHREERPPSRDGSARGGAREDTHREERPPSRDGSARGGAREDTHREERPPSRDDSARGNGTIFYAAPGAVAAAVTRPIDPIERTRRAITIAPVQIVDPAAAELESRSTAAARASNAQDGGRDVQRAGQGWYRMEGLGEHGGGTPAAATAAALSIAAVTPAPATSAPFTGTASMQTRTSRLDVHPYQNQHERDAESDDSGLLDLELGMGGRGRRTSSRHPWGQPVAPDADSQTSENHTTRAVNITIARDEKLALHNRGIAPALGSLPVPKQHPPEGGAATHEPSSTLARPPMVEMQQRSEHDRAVLVTLFEQCRGNIWVNRENWGSPQALSKWFNVTVDRGRVTELYLPRNCLSGKIPAELGMLSFLQSLSLHRNVLFGQIPPNIGGLSSLLHLDLHGNHLSGAIPREIGNLRLLEKLFLGKNHLVGEIPREIGLLTKLRLVYLQENELEGEIPTTFGELRNLQGLDLSSNALQGSIPTEICGLPALQELTIENNGLTGAIPPEIGNLQRLQVLKLGNNYLSGDIPMELEYISSLEQLELEGNDDLTEDGHVTEDRGELVSLIDGLNSSPF